MQTYNNSTDSAKMKITETITERKQVEKEISIPYYFRDKDKNFCKVVSKQHLLIVDADKNYWGAKTLLVDYNKVRIAEGTEISEDEYNYAFQKALDFVHALNQNDDIPTDEDENVKIDEILYDQR